MVARAVYGAGDQPGGILMTVQALFFDVFGTLMDWRTSIAREAQTILAPLGHSLDWLAFADAWRGEYQPAMEEVRAGTIPFSKLDVLHLRNLERVLPRFHITGLDEPVPGQIEVLQHVLRNAGNLEARKDEVEVAPV